MKRIAINPQAHHTYGDQEFEEEGVCKELEELLHRNTPILVPQGLPLECLRRQQSDFRIAKSSLTSYWQV